MSRPLLSPEPLGFAAQPLLGSRTSRVRVQVIADRAAWFAVGAVIATLVSRGF